MLCFLVLTSRLYRMARGDEAFTVPLFHIEPATLKDESDDQSRSRSHSPQQARSGTPGTVSRFQPYLVLIVRFQPQARGPSDRRSGSRIFQMATTTMWVLSLRPAPQDLRGCPAAAAGWDGESESGGRMSTGKTACDAAATARWLRHALLLHCAATRLGSPPKRTRTTKWT